MNEPRRIKDLTTHQARAALASLDESRSTPVARALIHAMCRNMGVLDICDLIEDYFKATGIRITVSFDPRDLPPGAVPLTRIAEARRIVEAARAGLGMDLGGHSMTDLLLDNMPDLRTMEDAKRLVQLLGGSSND